MEYISLFNKPTNDTLICFTQSDKVAIGKHDVIETAFQVGNFFNILQNSTNEDSIKAFKHNLLLELNRLYQFEQVSAFRHTELIELILVQDYKKTKKQFCEKLVKLYPNYYSK